MGEIIFQIHPCVIVAQDLPVGASPFGHGLGPILAHAHSVAIAPGVQPDALLRHTDLEHRGPEPQNAAKLRPGEADAPDFQGGHPASLRLPEGTKPGLRSAAEIRLRGDLQNGGGKRLRGENLQILIVGCLLSGTVHRLEIGDIRAPHLHRRLRPSAGAGEEGGVDQLSLVGQHLSIRIADGPVHGLKPRLPLPGGVVRRVPPPLAAARVRADIRLLVLAVLRAPEGIGPGYHRLGLDGLGRKAGGNLRQKHPGEIFIQGHIRNAPVLHENLQGTQLVPGRGLCDLHCLRLRLPLRRLPLRSQAHRQKRKPKPHRKGSRRQLHCTLHCLSTPLSGLHHTTAPPEMPSDSRREN